ncbi:MAG: Methylated-DNA-(protein)-cysteine S-methyltransferase binding protein [Actinomycetia bacterium]|nr:Methylated-DNA-(protein)-cysteine S-methyltransferase binding protein [Actinomycetes bacterium]
MSSAGRSGVRDPDATNELVRGIVASIPPGRVMAYGDIAALLPAGGPRTVGRIMREDSHDLPWWRVVNASGRPAPGAEVAARERYRAEGTPLKERVDGTYVVDYEATRWTPGP